MLFLFLFPYAKIIHKDDFDFRIDTDPETDFPTCYECYPGALEAVYKGKSCTIYELEEKGFLRGMTSWSPEMVCETVVPVAVKTELQRQHISKELIEYGLREAKHRGYKAVMVEGNPKNYNPRGFKTSADYGIMAGENVHLPAPECLMMQELVPGALEHMKGEVDYSFYESLK